MSGGASSSASNRDRSWWRTYRARRQPIDIDLLEDPAQRPWRDVATVFNARAANFRSVQWLLNVGCPIGLVGTASPIIMVMWLFYQLAEAFSYGHSSLVREALLADQAPLARRRMFRQVLVNTAVVSANTAAAIAFARPRIALWVAVVWAVIIVYNGFDLVAVRAISTTQTMIQVGIGVGAIAVRQLWLDPLDLSDAALGVSAMIFSLLCALGLQAVGRTAYYDRILLGELRFTEALRETESARRALAFEQDLLVVAFEASELGFAIVDEDGSLVRHNDALEQLVGARLPGNLSDVLGTLPEPRVVRRVELSHERLLDVMTSHLADSLTLVVVSDASRLAMLEVVSLQMAKASAVSSLTSGVAHEFNNLLMVISGAAEVLAPTNQLEGEQRMLGAIRDATSAGAVLTTSLLSLGQRRELQPETLSLAELVERVLPLLERSAEGAHRVEAEVKNADVIVSVDVSVLTTTLVNLCRNAIDATVGGGAIALTVSTSREGAVDYAVFTVSDRGTGMSESVLAHATEPFFTTKAPTEGSGLGLAMVTSLVERLGGRFELSSQEGNGTEATILIPLTESALVDARSPSRDPSSAALPADSQPASVLVIEDDQRVSGTIAHMLTSMGHSVTAVDRMGALLDLDLRAFDLALCDVWMGGDTGVDFALALRARRPDLPVAFVSANFPPRLMGAIEELEPVGLLNKPFTSRQLTQIIEKALDNAS